MFPTKSNNIKSMDPNRLTLQSYTILFEMIVLTIIEFKIQKTPKKDDFIPLDSFHNLLCFNIAFKII